MKGKGYIQTSYRFRSRRKHSGMQHPACPTVPSLPFSLQRYFHASSLDVKGPERWGNGKKSISIKQTIGIFGV